MSKIIRDIEWNGVEVEVHFYFTKGYAAKTWALPEDCYPGEDDEWEIDKIMYKEVSVLPLFSEDDIEKVIEILDEGRCDD